MAMKGLNLKQHDRTLWLLALILPITTVLLSWILYQIEGDARTLLVFISETDHPGPETWSFKLGFFATGLVDILLGWRMYHLLRQDDKKFDTIFVTSFFTGLGLILVAIFRWEDYPTMHLVGAIPVFAFGTAWGISVHRLSSTLELDQRGMKIRRISVPMTILSVIGLFISFQIAVINHPSLLESLQLNKVTIEMLFAAGFEWLLFVGFMLTIYSFKWDIIPLQTSEPESSDHSV